MQHSEVITILKQKADRSEYGIGNNRIDVKKVLDDYYLLLAQ